MFNNSDAVITITSDATMKHLLNESLWNEINGCVRRLSIEKDGLSIGFNKVEGYLDGRGFQPGQFVVLLSKPKVGKTFLVSNAIHYLVGQRIPVLFISIEMNAYSIIKRMFRLELGVGYDRIREIAATGGGCLFEVSKRWLECLYLVDMKSINLKAIDHLISMVKPAIVFIDYLQIVEQHGDTEMEKVSRIAKGIADISQSRQTIIVTLAQTAKDETPGSKMPSSSSGKWSSDIHIAADVIIGMCRPDIDPDVTNNKKSQIELQIIESRYGGSSPAIAYHYDPMTTELMEVGEWDSKSRL